MSKGRKDTQDTRDKKDLGSRVLRARLAAFLGLVLLMAVPLRAGEPMRLWRWIEPYDWQGLRELGPGVMPDLVRLYRETPDPDRRARVAMAMYALGWKSEPARQALMADVHTAHEELRLQVQWALGRVSNDDSVVDTLLDTLLNDPNPLFRDKAGCGLANDQVHLTEAQKLRLFARLVGLLEAPNLETRSLAIRILVAYTGQNKGFWAQMPEPKRSERVTRWKQWLEEYRAALAPPS